MKNNENTGHLQGVDGWRAVLLVMGVGVHAITAPTGVYQWVGVTTHAFRMEAFFAISGFFAACALRRQAPAVWLRSRLAVLGIPMMVAVLALNPIALLLNRSARATRDGKAVDLTEHLRPAFLHVWFLWVLLLCCIAAAWLAAREEPVLPARVRRVGAAIVSATPSHLRWPALLLSLYVPLAALAWGEQAVWPLVQALPRETVEHKLLVALVESGTLTFPYYAEFFFLGMALARLDQARRACMAWWPMHATLVVMGAGWIAVSYAAHGYAVFPYIYALYAAHPFHIWGSKVLIGLPATLLVLRQGLLATRTPAIMAELARASYTIFVCHMLLIDAVAFALGPAWWGSVAHYLAVVVLATAGGYAVHVALVERFAWAALLLGGRIARPAPRRAALVEGSVRIA